MRYRALPLPMWLLAAAVPACSGGLVQTPGCRYEAVAIEAVAPRTFAGRAAGVDVQLTSERDGAVESFPDSALALGAAGGRCEVEGGVWQRRGVFVAPDGRTVAALESSGSNDALVFIDAASCRRVGSIDVSGSHWRFADGMVVARRAHRLDNACRPDPAR